MKLIPLTQGKFATVDDDDYETLSKLKWQAHKRRSSETYYAVTNIKLGVNKWKSIKMHRHIMNITNPQLLVDHRDMDGLNNQKSNLRIANKSQNGANRKPKPNCTSNYLGVSWYRAKSKWRANIQKNRKITHLGYFMSEVEAAKAYNEAASQLHGEFAKLNNVL